MAPERIDGQDYGYASDIWSLGLTFLTVALGRLPIDTSGGFWSILNSIRDSTPPAVPDDGTFSEDFRDFISLCLRHDPKHRATSDELLQHPFLNKAMPESC